MGVVLPEAMPSSPAGPQILASAATGIVDMIAMLGGDADRIFGTAHVDVHCLDSPFNELSLGQYCQLFEEAARQTRYDNFGLRFGYGFKPRQLGAIGYMAVNSPTLAAALRNLCAYFPAHQQNSTLALRQERDLIYLDYRIDDGRIGRRRQDAELSVGMFCNIFWHALGRSWRPVEIHFEHPRPLDAKEHESLYDAPVYFAQAFNSVVFRRTDLDALMPDADPYLFSLLEPFMSGRCKRAQPSDLVGLVRQKIETQLQHGNPSIKKVAAELGMTSWTLHRRLHDLEVNFNDLVRGARRELALRYVAEPHIALTEVAFLLGYSELSAFSRAFRQWTGMAPARYRRQHALGRRSPPLAATDE
ncbi:MAG: AraC-like transcriptional regulator QhpR [Pseudomonadota bacterium]